MNITIERANESMADVFGDIESLVYPNGKHWSGEMFFKDMKESNRLYLVAKDGEKIIGFISASYFMENADILRVAVLPEYQGKDVATELMAELFDGLKKLLVKKIMLEVNKANDKAQGLYEKVGFKEISNRKNYYGKGQDGLIYSVEL